MRWSGRVCGSTHSKVGVTDSLGLKSLHAYLMHRGEVGLDHVNTIPVSLENMLIALTRSKYRRVNIVNGKLKFGAPFCVKHYF